MPARVLVVDDSALVRRLLTGVLNESPGIQVVGTARDGAHALEQVTKLRPDLVTLDVEMPVMDGVAAMRELHRRYPRLPVIMVSTLTEQGAAVTFDALAAGASDYVTKPTNSASLVRSLEMLRDQLIPRVEALTARRAYPPQSRTAPPAQPAQQAATLSTTRTALAGVPRRGPVRLVAIGSSTGGPDALSRVLSALTSRPNVPLVLVQHMPPVFTTMLAQRLDRLGPANVVEAEHDQPLHAGTVYVAPGGRHLEVQRHGTGLRVVLTDAAPENYSRPSVDVLFRSVAATNPSDTLAVVLTGMGRDGQAGCEQLRAGGSLIVAQDEATSVVWGMPRAVAEAGLADEVLPLDDIGPFLARHVTGSPRETVQP